MASTEKECAYVKCDKKFYGGERARYCCDKHGQYQRRLDNKENEMEDDKITYNAIYGKDCPLKSKEDAESFVRAQDDFKDDNVRYLLINMDEQKV